MSVLASPKQINFILSLADQKDVSEVHPIAVGCIDDIRLGYSDSINKKYASKMIEILLAAPKKVTVKSNDPDVPAGRYALEIDGKLRFFHVNRPDNGRWKGFVFLNEQSGSELFSIRHPEPRKNILNLIAKDEESIARYGQELGICGMCGRELTDAESRYYGIGPVCRKK